jgi:biopolymer transport protein ExbD
MSGRGNRMQTKNEELNLIPIMGLMVLLIPMVLFLYNFFEVKVQAVAAPRLGSAAQKKPDDDAKKPLNLTVHISKSGFQIKIQEDLMVEPIPAIPKRVFTGMTEEEYDYPALYTRLRTFKDNPAYDKENTVNVSADMDIPWQTVARTIDAARLKLVEPSYDDLKTFAHAAPLEVEVPDRDGDGKADKEVVEMFSRVVFVVAEAN